MVRPILTDFINWLKDKAEAWKTQCWRAIETKAARRVFVSATTVEENFGNPVCIFCKGKLVLSKCSVFKEKIPTQWGNVSAVNNFFSACKGTTHSVSILEQRNATSRDAPTPIVYFSEVLNVSIFVKIPTKLTTTKASKLVKQKLMRARMKRTQTLIENLLARLYQKQIWTMRTPIPLRWM